MTIGNELRKILVEFNLRNDRKLKKLATVGNYRIYISNILQQGLL